MDFSSDAFNLISFDTDEGTANIIDLDEEDDGDSDGTLLGDDFEELYIRPSPDIEFIRSQPRNPETTLGTQRLDSFSSDGRTYKIGNPVELIDGDFLRIAAIVRGESHGTVLLEGFRFRRNKQLQGLLELKRNEVTMLLQEEENDDRDIYSQSVQTIQLFEVVRFRELVKTNQAFPAFSYRETDPYRDKDYVYQHGRLVCRAKLSQVSKNEGWLQFFTEDEVDQGYGIDARQLKYDFRGVTEKGGICPTWLDGEREFDKAEHVRFQDVPHRGSLMRNFGTVGDTIDLTDDIPNSSRRYTFGDAFCGAGGTSRGAKAAGLRVDWGFDFDQPSIDSYRRNFYGARCECIAAHDFVNVLDEDFKVDVLHMSPPCKTFSPFHVHPGQNDEMNEATFFAIEEILKKTKPRTVTLEETFGLSATLKHQSWFRAMIQVFSRLRFSIRWKVFNLCVFGLAQPRKRLIIIASCPGEPLPTFPAPTHCKATDQWRFPDLLPFTSVNDAIAQIPRGHPLHDPDQVRRCDEVPYDGNFPARRTICGPTNMYCHSSGKRILTVAELASLQGFPLEHQFGPRGAREQIGNAVPPCFARVLYEHIRKHLLQVDGLA